jgi:hypothetical protein
MKSCERTLKIDIEKKGVEMAKTLVMALSLCLALASGYEGLYGVVRGGTIHQFNPTSYRDADWLYFSNGIEFDVREGEPEIPENLRLEKSDYYLVHCAGPVYPEQVRIIESAGAKVYSYIPNYAFLVKMDEIMKHVIQNLDFVDWIGVYQPAYKISGQNEFKTLQGMQKVTILLYPDAGLEEVIGFLESLGAKIVDTAHSKWDKLIICDVDLLNIPEIAKIEEINWIEPWHKIELHNDNVQWILQTGSSGNRRIWDMGITGDGELLSTSDTGIRTSHYAFRNTNSTWITTWGDYPSHRKIIAYQPASTMGPGWNDFGDEGINSYHGTHTAGTACGNDDVMGSPSTRDGIGIDSRIYFLDGGGSQGAVYTYSNLNDLFILPYNGNAAGSVKIMSNSWGSEAQGAYTARSAQSDQFMWTHKDFLLFFSNGNNPPDVYVGSPATAKNCVSVGSCGNAGNYQYFSSFSARGPTNDGRRKPTILAPGSSVYSASGGTDNGYANMSGTSMSSPGAAGAAVLVRQYFSDGWYPTGSANPSDSIAPSAALIKAMLINSADPSISGHTIPDDYVGWGRIDLDSVIYFAGDNKKLAVIDQETGLSTGQYVEYTYNVVSSAVPFRVALVWTDYPASTGAGIRLINDLHLTVTDPSANQYKGNTYSGGQSVTGGSYDTLNVEECVRRNSPATGNWTIRIDGNNCPYGPQPFAIVVNGDLLITAQPNVVYASNTIDDSGGNNNGKVDPGETVYMTVELRNDGDLDATASTGTLRALSTYITLIDSVAAYNTIPASGGTGQGTFQFSASSSTPQGTVVPMTVYLVANGGAYTTNCNFNITVGEVSTHDWVTHDVGNCRLTVTRHGAIGYMSTAQFEGDGFCYPSTSDSRLYYGGFAAGTDSSYCVDRYMGDPSDDADWETTGYPDGRIQMFEPGPNNLDEYATARYDDSNHPLAKGLLCLQSSWAWDDAPANDFVITEFTLINEGIEVLTDIYAAVFMDWDVGNYLNNQGSSDASRNLSWMYENTPYVGVAILNPPRETPAANLALIDHDLYVYPAGLPNDSIKFKFMNGTYQNPSSNRTDDWSTCNSAGPFTLNPGDTVVTAFAIIGGDNLNDLQVNADTAYGRYWNWPGVQEMPSPGLVTDIKIYPAISFGHPYTFKYGFAKETPVRIKVYDALGRLIENKNYGVLNGTGEFSLNLKSLAQGVYFIEVEAENRTTSTKIIWLK